MVLKETDKNVWLRNLTQWSDDLKVDSSPEKAMLMACKITAL